MTGIPAEESNVTASDVVKTLGLVRDRSLARRLKAYLLWSGGILLLLIVLLWTVNKRSSGSQLNYQFQELTRGDLVVTVSATGTLQPTNQVDVGSEISGTLKRIEVDYK